jgi:hypothetical protein
MRQSQVHFDGAIGIEKIEYVSLGIARAARRRRGESAACPRGGELVSMIVVVIAAAPVALGKRAARRLAVERTTFRPSRQS